MPSELKKYKLKATRRPKASAYLASRVMVTDDQGITGYCYITFSDEFVEAVGSALPQGVAIFSPAQIEVAFDPIVKKWLIGASYIGRGLPVILWESDTRPTWVKRITSKEHNDTAKNCENGSSSSASATGSAHRTPGIPSGFSVTSTTSARASTGPGFAFA